VIAESAIDALSYAALHPDEHARYASFGGAMNPNQPALIRSVVELLIAGATMRIATDNDADGDSFAGILKDLVVDTGRSDLVVKRVNPNGAKDWNDLLRSGRESGKEVLR
jgi:hypothetical protein